MYIHTYRCFWSWEVDSFGHTFRFNFSIIHFYRKILLTIYIHTHCTYIHTYTAIVWVGRKSSGDISGSILFGNAPRSQAVMRSTAYVTQDNVHYPQLTVLETLLFAAKLRYRPIVHTYIHTYLYIHIILIHKYIYSLKNTCVNTLKLHIHSYT